ncbi:MAG: histidine kinase dimerization/phosphoacceptor domain -containing protein, partial [Ignavibacteriales bacterium]
MKSPFKNLEKTLIHKDGYAVVLEASGSPIFSTEGILRGYRGIARDITERKRAEKALRKAHEELEIRVGERTADLTRVNEALQAEISERKRAEEQIKTSLQEKEVLLREIHHRVKNNLQVISSLLHLQAGYIKDKRILKIFIESQMRIKSMALIHEQLYRSKDLTRIDFSRYIRELTDNLKRSYGMVSGLINFNMDMDRVSLGIDTAISCGLVINELISNSLKHAFPESREGEIRISLHSYNISDEQAGDGRPLPKPMASDFSSSSKSYKRSATDHLNFALSISDNGIGFPENLDFRNTESLGLQLVTVLVDQIGGTIELNRDSGTEFKITFKELKKKKG